MTKVIWETKNYELNIIMFTIKISIQHCKEKFTILTGSTVFAESDFESLGWKHYDPGHNLIPCTKTIINRSVKKAWVVLIRCGFIIGHIYIQANTLETQS